jgi:hypothetical protein
LIHRQHVLLLQREMARVLARALRDEGHC